LTGRQVADETVPDIYREPANRERISLINSSFESLTGRCLVEPAADPIAAMWKVPRAILAHGNEPDPIFFFANDYALRVFEYDLETILKTPSRMSAEAPARTERAALLERVMREGFIDDYSGVRITSSGRRFRIENATVWNLLDEAGQHCGQAATFVL